MSLVEFGMNHATLTQYLGAQINQDTTMMDEYIGYLNSFLHDQKVHQNKS